MKWINNEISWVIVAGIIGFLISSVMLSGRQWGNSSTGYHEVIITNKDAVIQEIYKNRLNSLQDSLTRIPSDSPNAQKLKGEIRRAISALLVDTARLFVGATDTISRFYSGIFLVNYQELRDIIASFQWPQDSLRSQTLTLLYCDTNSLTTQSPAIISKNVQVHISKPSSLLSFVTDNVTAGLWLIVSIAQMVLWCMVLPLLYGRLRYLNQKIVNLPGGLFSVLNWILSSIIPIAFLALFCGLFYYILIDTVVIKDHYLLTGFNGKMKFYAILGYLISAGCFGMFLHMSMALDLLNKYAQSRGVSLAQNTQVKEFYDAIKKTFEGSFLATSIILSTFVLWISITFTTINQTEAMRFYKMVSGKDYLSYDYVYLVGAFHTLILLLFYIPVRIRFNALDITGQAQGSQSSPTSRKVISNIYDAIGTLLVTASPILTSLVQKLIKNLIESN